MHAAVGTIELFLPGSNSLKDKRQIVQSIVQRIRSRVNVSVAETEFQNTWQRAGIGVAMVSNDKKLLDRQVEVIRRIVDDCAEAEMLEFLLEYI